MLRIPRRASLSNPLEVSYLFWNTQTLAVEVGDVLPVTQLCKPVNQITSLKHQFPQEAYSVNVICRKHVTTVFWALVIGALAGRLGAGRAALLTSLVRWVAPDPIMTSIKQVAFVTVHQKAKQIGLPKGNHICQGGSSFPLAVVHSGAQTLTFHSQNTNADCHTRILLDRPS